MKKLLSVFITSVLLVSSPAAAQTTTPKPAAAAATDAPKPTAPVVAEKEKELTVTSQLLAENLKLRAQIEQLKIDNADLRAQLATKILTLQQSQLEQAFRTELGCAPTVEFDWATLKCAKVKKDEQTKKDSK